MATLVIGTGLVGSQIARILAEQGETPVLMDPAAQPEAIEEVVALDRVTMIKGDVLRPLDITKAILDHGITDIIHTAANPMLTLGAQQDPFAAIQLNIMGTVNVLEAAKVHKLRRVVVSSSSVLNHYMEGGEGRSAMMKEEAFARPSTFYSATKQTVESLGLNYARWCGVDFAAMRYGAVCGPWSGHGGGGPSNVFRGAVEKALSGQEAVVPSSDMEWVYSKDAGRGTVLALRAADLSSRVFNITMGCIVTPDEFAAALKKAIPNARLKLQKKEDVDVSMQTQRTQSDPELSKKVLGFEPEYGIDEAVADMVRWLQVREQARARA